MYFKNFHVTTSKCLTKSKDYYVKLKTNQFYKVLEIIEQNNLTYFRAEEIKVTGDFSFNYEINHSNYQFFLDHIKIAELSGKIDSFLADDIEQKVVFQNSFFKKTDLVQNKKKAT